MTDFTLVPGRLWSSDHGTQETRDVLKMKIVCVTVIFGELGW